MEVDPDDRVEDVRGHLRVVVPVARFVPEARENELRAARFAGPLFRLEACLGLAVQANRGGSCERAATHRAKSYKMPASVEYHITHYDLEQGALEIQYIEEFFGEFRRKKTATEIVPPARAGAITSSCSRMRRCPMIPGSVVPCRSRSRTRSRRPRPSRSSSIWSSGWASTCSSSAAGAVHVDWRDAPRLARAGLFPRPDRAAGARGRSSRASTRLS